MSFAPQLYAVVSRTGEAPPRRSLTVVKSEKLAELKQKKAIDRANALLDRLQARQERLDAEIAALQRRKRNACERAERIGDRIIAELEAAALTRADGFQTAVLTVPSPAAVDVFDEALLPDAYWRDPKPPKRTPDKVAIKAAIEKKLKVPGARLVQGVSLRRS